MSKNFSSISMIKRRIIWKKKEQKLIVKCNTIITLSSRCYFISEQQYRVRISVIHFARVHESSHAQRCFASIMSYRYRYTHPCRDAPFRQSRTRYLCVNRKMSCHLAQGRDKCFRSLKPDGREAERCVFLPLFLYFFFFQKLYSWSLQSNKNPE